MNFDDKSTLALGAAIALAIVALLSVVVTYIDPLPKMAERSRAAKVIAPNFNLVTNATEQDVNRLANAYDKAQDAIGEACAGLSRGEYKEYLEELKAHLQCLIDCWEEEEEAKNG